VNTPRPCQPALARCEHGVGKGGRASQLPAPPGIPRDAGAGLFSPALNARLYSGSPSGAAVINPGHLPSRASTNTASLGLANKATTTIKKELIPQRWHWAARYHITLGGNREPGRGGGKQAGAEPVARWSQPQLCWEFQQRRFQGGSRCPRPGGFICSVRRGSASPGAGKGRKRVQEEKRPCRGCFQGRRGECEPPSAPWGCCCGQSGIKPRAWHL